MRKICLLACCLLPSLARANDELFLVDKVIANVGTENILLSDFEAAKFQLRYHNQVFKEDKLLETLIANAALISKAKDNAVLSDNKAINGMVEERINLILEQFHNDPELIKTYLGKGVSQIKKDLKRQLHDPYLTEKMQMKMLGDIRCTYKDVCKFYEYLVKKDKVPTVEESVEAYKLVLLQEEDPKILNTLLEIRKKVDDGEDFISLVKEYSQDEDTVANGGELGWFKLGELKEEYERAALRLKPGEVSKIVKTDLGYHIIQLIDFNKEEYNTRHIFLYANFDKDISPLFEKAAKIKEQILAAKGPFDERIKKFHFVRIEELNEEEKEVVKGLKDGEISEPVECVEENKNGVKMIFLRQRRLEHKMNINEDYEALLRMTKNYKRSKIAKQRQKDIVNNTYIKLDLPESN